MPTGISSLREKPKDPKLLDQSYNGLPDPLNGLSGRCRCSSRNRWHRRLFTAKPIHALARDYDDFGKHMIPAALQKYRVFRLYLSGVLEQIGQYGVFEVEPGSNHPVPVLRFVVRIKSNLHPAALPAVKQGQRKTWFNGRLSPMALSLPMRRHRPGGRRDSEA